MGNYFNYSGRGERTELQKSEKQKRGDRDLQGSPNDTEGRGGKEGGDEGGRREERRQKKKVRKTKNPVKPSRKEGSKMSFSIFN